MRLTGLLSLGSVPFSLAAALAVDFSVSHLAGQIQLSATGSICNTNKFKYDCSGKADGNYPHPYDCSYYISCIGQTNATETPCPSNSDGSLLYYVQHSGPDPATSHCDYPEVVGCGCEKEDEAKCPCHKESA